MYTEKWPPERSSRDSSQHERENQILNDDRNYSTHDMQAAPGYTPGMPEFTSASVDKPQMFLPQFKFVTAMIAINSVVFIAEMYYI
jgi:hypothetical protein